MDEKKRKNLKVTLIVAGLCTLLVAGTVVGTVAVMKSNEAAAKVIQSVVNEAAAQTLA